MDSLVSTGLATLGIIAVELVRGWFGDRLERLQQSRLEKCESKVEQLLRELAIIRAEMILWRERYMSVTKYPTHE